MDNRFLVRNLPMDWSWQDVHGWLSTLDITASWVHLFGRVRQVQDQQSGFIHIPGHVDVHYVLQSLSSCWLTHRQVQVQLANESHRVHWPGAKPKCVPKQPFQPPPQADPAPPVPVAPSKAATQTRLLSQAPVTPPKASPKEPQPQALPDPSKSKAAPAHCSSPKSSSPALAPSPSGEPENMAMSPASDATSPADADEFGQPLTATWLKPCQWGMQVVVTTGRSASTSTKCSGILMEPCTLLGVTAARAFVAAAMSPASTMLAHFFLGLFWGSMWVLAGSSAMFF